MTTSEVLNKAADLIEERGWTQGTDGWASVHNNSTPLCLEGGIQAAMGLAVGDGTRGGSITAVMRCPAYKAVLEYLQLPKSEQVYPWNDRPERTNEEVIETLRAAALIESSKEAKVERVSVP